MSAYDEALALAQRMRGVVDPCPLCQGLGWRMYSSGSTWRGGMGTASFAHDVCDVCWGSGDAARPVADLRAMESARAGWDEYQCMRWLSGQLGAELPTIRKRIAALSEHCYAQVRKRKLPEGENAFWWCSSWHALGNMLAKLSADRKPGGAQ